MGGGGGAGGAWWVTHGAGSMYWGAGVRRSGTPEEWGGTPRGWPRGQEGGTPRGWNPQEGISVCWALEDTSANSHEGIYIYC